MVLVSELVTVGGDVDDRSHAALAVRFRCQGHDVGSVHGDPGSGRAVICSRMGAPNLDTLHLHENTCNCAS